jgi:hypothetical protein
MSAIAGGPDQIDGQRCSLRFGLKVILRDLAAAHTVGAAAQDCFIDYLPFELRTGPSTILGLASGSLVRSILAYERGNAPRRLTREAGSHRGTERRTCVGASQVPVWRRPRLPRLVDD